MRPRILACYALLCLLPPASASTKAQPSQSAAPEATLRKTGPKSLIISYRADPPQRPAFRKYLMGRHTERLNAMKRSGAIEDFSIFYGWYVQPASWDALLVIRFRRFEDAARWNEAERDGPGGLDKEGLTLATPVSTVAADLEWTQANTRDRTGRVYYFLQYSVQNAAEYRRYVPGYLLPQLDGWRKDGALAGYGLFINRFGSEDGWDSLLMLAYRDMEGFGRRAVVQETVRDRLRQDPEWKGWSDRKDGIRRNTVNTVAELLPNPDQHTLPR